MKRFLIACLVLLVLGRWVGEEISESSTIVLTLAMVACLGLLLRGVDAAGQSAASEAPSSHQSRTEPEDAQLAAELACRELQEEFDRLRSDPLRSRNEDEWRDLYYRASRVDDNYELAYLYLEQSQTYRRLTTVIGDEIWSRFAGRGWAPKL